MPQPLRDGVYRIYYRSLDDPIFGPEHALAVMREGQVIGSDPCGGIFSSAADRDGDDPGVIRLQLTVPPCGELVTGYLAGFEGATIEISSTLNPLANTQRSIVDIEGDPVEIEVMYLGPLPT